MKERPIIFSGPMVRAILDGRKTQTRRVVKPQPIYVTGDGKHSKWSWRDGIFAFKMYPSRSTILRHCPYGVPGDRLWVKETWQEVHPIQVTEGRYCIDGRAGIPGPPPVSYRVIYRADGEYPPVWHCVGFPYRSLNTTDAVLSKHFPRGMEYSWCPSTHMPRWASRVTLEITGVRVERLQDISEDDAVAEGSQIPIAEYGGRVAMTERQAFSNIWNSLNAKRAPWDSNPWVWVIEFKKVEGDRAYP